MTNANKSLLPSRSFFTQKTQTIARQILGWCLKSTINGKLTGGIIVETEAYLPSDDDACHGVRGKTKSNAAMFGPAGRAYVYPIHAKYCFNIVTQAEGEPTAVLIRSLQPLFGIPTIENRRKMTDPRKLTTGPSRLCQSLGIDRSIDHWDLTIGKTVWLEKASSVEQNEHGFECDFEICQTERIGVTSAKSKKLRFAIRHNRFVSGPKRLRS